MFNYDVVVVGAGVTGCTAAQQLAAQHNKRVLVLEQADTVGGMCQSYWDKDTGIEVHKYGTHVFHTNSRFVYDYIKKFCVLNNYQHKVLVWYNGKPYFLPINLMTVNAFFGDTYYTPQNPPPAEAIEAVKAAFYTGYSKKQWGVPLSELPDDVLNRIPIRNDYNVRFFDALYEGVPVSGWCKFFETILAHPKITVKTSTPFLEYKKTVLVKNIPVVYTGRIDEYFDLLYGALAWRAVSFNIHRYEEPQNKTVQGTAVVNYASVAEPQTRTHEYKYLHPELLSRVKGSLIGYEYPNDGSLPESLVAYPFKQKRGSNVSLEQKYLEFGMNEFRNRGVRFAGRLGRYSYINIDEAIYDGINAASDVVSWLKYGA